MKKTLLFDLDGTLIDSTEAILEGFDVAYKKFGHPTPKEEAITSLIGHPLEIMFEKLGMQKEVDQYVTAYKEHYQKISRQKTQLLPDAREAIKVASKIARLGIVTTKTARYSAELLEHMGIMDYFEVLIGRESVANPKPHPEPILKAMSMLQADPKTTWMIGDTALDLLSAKNANIQAVGVLCGYGKEQELAQHTAFIAKNSLSAVKMLSAYISPEKDDHNSFT